MKRYLIVLALLCLAVAAVPAGAVELQEGWYAEFDDVQLQGTRIDENNNPISWGTRWYATSALVPSGPIIVEGYGPAGGSYGRKITVLQNTPVSPGVLWEDVGSYSGSYPYFDEVHVAWETNYNADIMQLQMLRRRAGQPDELVWAQSESDYAVGYGNAWYSGPVYPGDQVVLRVVAVPEPTGLIMLGLGPILIAWRGRKRK